MCKLDLDGVIECCRVIDDFIIVFSNIKSLNMERLNILIKYFSICLIFFKEGNYEGCIIVYRKMLEELKI